MGLATASAIKAPALSTASRTLDNRVSTRLACRPARAQQSVAADCTSADLQVHRPVSVSFQRFCPSGREPCKQFADIGN